MCRIAHSVAAIAISSEPGGLTEGVARDTFAVSRLPVTQTLTFSSGMCGFDFDSALSRNIVTQAAACPAPANGIHDSVSVAAEIAVPAGTAPLAVAISAMVSPSALVSPKPMWDGSNMVEQADSIKLA